MDTVVWRLLRDRAGVHRRSHTWSLVGISRCTTCHLRWPCLARRSAIRALRIALNLPRRSI